MERPMATGRKAAEAPRGKRGREPGGWGCPHDDRGTCARRAAPCDPLARGCVLAERGGQAPPPAPKEDER